MRFWDSSALVPLLVTEAATRPLQILADRDAKKLIWWATEAECASAITRRLRDQALDAAGASLALGRLRQLVSACHEIEPSPVVRETAIRFLRVHPLRTADALQLAAAFIAAGGQPSSLEMVTLDDRLSEAARKEGFGIIDVRTA